MLDILSYILGSPLVSGSPINRPSYPLQQHNIKKTQLRKETAAHGESFNRQLQLMLTRQGRKNEGR